MNKYKEIADLHRAKENKISNYFISFICGGLMGFFAELIIECLINWFKLSRDISSIVMIIIFIFFSCLFTSLGFFDKLVTKYKCGLIIPITGFAHSVMSSSLDSKNEGLIYGIGSNMFKLAGSVIVYGIVSAFVFGLIRYLIGGV
jgi:stage V sporulation protein AC